MSLSKQKFQSLATKLFEKAKAGNLTGLAVFSKPGGQKDPITGQAPAGLSDTVDCIREEYSSQETDGIQVHVNDFKLIIQTQSFVNLSPRDNLVTVEFEGEQLSVVNASKDPADVIWTIQVRAT